MLKRPWFAPGVIVLVALSLRLVYFQQIATSPLFEHPIYDAKEYAAWAQEIAQGRFAWDHVRLYYPPGYPYFLGFLSFLTGHDLPAMTFANALLGCGWIVLLVLGVRRLLPAPAAEVSGLVAATYWGFLHFEGHLLATTWFTFLLVLGFFLLTLGEPASRLPRRAGILAAAGLALGAAVVTRPNALATVPFLLALPLLDTRSRRDALARWIPFTVALVVVITPVLVHNYRLSGMLAFRHHTAFNVWMGNRPDGTGWASIRPGREWERESSRAAREANARTLADHERFYRREMLQFVRDDPGAFLTLQLRKSLLFFNEREIRATMSPYFRERFAPLQRVLLGFGWVAPFAIVGLGLGLRVTRPPWLLYAFAVPQAATVILTVVGSRYRIPVVPFLIPFAALAAIRLVQWVRARRLVPAGVLAGGIVVAALVVHLDFPELQEPGFAEEMGRVAAGFDERGDVEEAARWWVRAFEEDPSRIETYVGFAELAVTAGDAARAEEVARTGLARAPGDPDLLRIRGRALLLMGQADTAVVALESAARARPERADVHADLARALYDAGRPDEAVVSFRTSLRLEPRDTGVLLDAATVLHETGSVRADDDMRAAAVELLESVLAIDPNQAEARGRLERWR